MNYKFNFTISDDHFKPASEGKKDETSVEIEEEEVDQVDYSTQTETQ